MVKLVGKEVGKTGYGLMGVYSSSLVVENVYLFVQV
jgi:hypothetical protein